MQLDKVITLANKKVRLKFLALERSLRQSGCNLPIWVIPYDDNKFELPENSIWWEDKSFFQWLDSNNAHRLTRKYLCLTEKNYHFLDTDIVALKNPQDILIPYNGFVASCGHWHSQEQTFTPDSLQILKAKSTSWQRDCFNSGQFACDEAIYTIETLKEACVRPESISTCITFKDTKHEQPGFNLLVNISPISIYNLSFPPALIESTWAGDYPHEYLPYWKNETSKPYIIHWAGLRVDGSRPIDDLFFKYLTQEEKQEWFDMLPKPMKKPSFIRKQAYFVKKFLTS
ncbi:hypothetical protein QNI19_15060 [Cytophagaceae bacterium DM2B3-1]|uniref:Glycosyl transferase n=1 Tax=Xanthocytophaga flava TaxID=3048013 RepID=A0ABT7CKJ3_9BACT|nr:hypothetical protein [Xanthocytophaga flavus]MDJ1469749.1 hypothetical protein [Xanthocytophaga flavus]MDJ1494261.1 hypothetical protein [Xanthocytophaga flavus]